MKKMFIYSRTAYGMLLLFLTINLACTGCAEDYNDIHEYNSSAAAENTGEASLDMTQTMTEQNARKEAFMTDEQKELLKNLFNDDEAIEQGILEPWELEILNKYNAGADYLSEKYPGSELEIISCERMSYAKQYDAFYFCQKGNSDAVYEIRIIADDSDDSKYQITDNYYSSLIHKEYEKMVEDAVSGSFPVIDVNAVFDSFLDDEYKPESLIAMMMSGEVELNPRITICIDIDRLDHGSFASNTDEIHDLLRIAGIRGYCILIFCEGGSSDTYLHRQSFYI